MNPSRQTRQLRGPSALMLLTILAQVTALPAAYAQVGSPSVVIAEKLFHEGQDLLEQSKTDESKTHPACEKFAESERLRPALGTLLNLAVCHEKEKKTASAWAEYTEVAGQASRAGQADRAQFASQHAAALEHQLCRVRLEMSAPPLGVEVRIDGQALGAASWGTDIPLDPGQHSIVVSAPGKQPWAHDVVLRSEQPLDREQVPPLADAIAAQPQPGTGGDAAPSATGSRSSLGYVVGGVGVAALAVGGIFLGRGVAYTSQSNDESSKAAGFQAGNPNKAAYSSAASSDKSAGTTSIAVGAVAGGLGLVGVGVGLYFMLSSPSKEAPPKAASLRVLPDIGPGRAGASLGFNF